MNLRTIYATCVRRWPRFFDISKAFARKFETPDHVYQLLSEYERKKGKVVFLQIGSNDGISNDPLREFIVRSRRWEGCLVEPLPHTFARLKRNYRYANRKALKFRNAAISDRTEELNFYRVKDQFHHEMPGHPDQVASFDPGHVLKHFPENLRSSEKIESVTVEALSPSALMAELGYERIDVLHLDVEGHEKMIFDSFPFEKFSPEIILFEHIHLSEGNRKAISGKLLDLNYALEAEGFDTIAVKKGC